MRAIQLARQTISLLIRQAPGGKFTWQIPLAKLGDSRVVHCTDNRRREYTGTMNVYTSGQDEMAKVQRLISTEPLVVFSKTYCSYSQRAKSLLNTLKASFTAVEVDTIKDGPLIQDALQQLTGRRTVPNIFLEGNSLGGSDELHGLYESGELQTLLKKAKII